MTDLAARGLRPLAELAAAKPCGTRLRYLAGCRCDACRRANFEYEKARARARAEGDWNGIVSADKARAHLRKLRRQGIGRRVVAQVTDLAPSIVQEIRQGKRTQIRGRTERKILAITRDQAGDNALVPAASAWKLIDELLDEGYTKPFLAKRLGYSKPVLQIQRERITVRTAARIERLHRELTT